MRFGHDCRQGHTGSPGCNRPRALYRRGAVPGDGRILTRHVPAAEWRPVNHRTTVNHPVDRRQAPHRLFDLPEQARAEPYCATWAASPRAASILRRATGLTNYVAYWTRACRDQTSRSPTTRKTVCTCRLLQLDHFVGSRSSLVSRLAARHRSALDRSTQAHDTG